MFLVGLMIGGFLFGSDIVRAVTFSTVNPPILPGDITGTQILDGTITDSDVSTTSAIDALKIQGGLPAGGILFSNGTQIATSSNLSYATSTNTLTVTGAAVVTGTTRLNGVTYTWPSADGTNGQTIQTNGAGTMSWGASAAAGNLASYTAAQTIAALIPVAIATTTYGLGTITATAGAGEIEFGNITTTRIATSWVTPTNTAAYFTGGSIKVKKVNSPVDNVYIALVSSNGANPGALAVATSSIANANITTSYQILNFTLNTPVFVAPGTTLWLVFSRTGSQDAVNYYSTQYDASHGYAAGGRAYEQAGSWTVIGTENASFVASTTPITQDYIFTATGDNFMNASTTIGWTNGAVTASTTANVLVSGIGTGFTGLIAGKPYYLCNTYGGFCTNISSTTSKVIGIGMSSTTMKVNPNLMGSAN